MPVGDVEIKGPGRLPAFVYIVLCIYLGTGLLVVVAAIISHRNRQKQIFKKNYPLVKVQLATWAVLVTGGIILSIVYRLDIGLLLILLAQFLPRGFAKSASKEDKSDVTSELSS